MTDRTVVVVPCYNEAERLRPSEFRALLRRRADADLLFVNDGSTDATAMVLESMRSAEPTRVGVLSIERNTGKAEAVRRGVLHAIDGGARLVAFWDADLATPLGAIDTFFDTLAARPELEIVIGARVQLLGRSIERRPARHYLGRVFATVISLVLGMRVYDTQCGAKLFTVTPALRAAFAAPFLSRWIFDVEILARLKSMDRAAAGSPLEARIFEVPLSEWRDVRGSKLRARDFVLAGPEIARIWWAYLRRGGRPGAPAPDLVSSRPPAAP